MENIKLVVKTQLRTWNLEGKAYVVKTTTVRPVGDKGGQEGLKADTNT